MSCLASRSGKNIDRRICDEQRFGIGRYIHDKDVAYPPRRAQSRARRRHSTHQLVGMQAALHQELAFALVDKLHGFGRSGIAVGNVNELKSANIDLDSLAIVLIFRAGPTRMGSINRRSAASVAPRSELSSQGCTTTVLAAATLLALAISRSYFDSAAMLTSLRWL
jgi:hypothetical protein